MAEDIVIIGAGGFGREVKWLIERMNAVSREKTGYDCWNLIGFIDDGYRVGERIQDSSVIGDVSWLSRTEKQLAVTCAIGNAAVRRKVIEKLLENEKITFPNLIDPSVKMSDSVKLGKGNIICADTILTVDIELGDFIILNLDCTVGHDSRLSSYVTVYPSVNISGNCKVGALTEIGTGSHIIQGKEIGENVIVGAGTVVIRDLPGMCTAVGNPARVIKDRNLL